MVYISQEIINQVKAAESEHEIIRIVDNSVSSLKSKSENWRIDKKYTRNVLMALKYQKTLESEPKALQNMNKAIEIFKKLHALGRENVL